MFNLFKKNNESWESIKESGKAYPKEIITLASMTNENDETINAWINTGYKDYPYKKYCKKLGILNVDFEDMNDLDYGEVQEYFEKELQKVCVSHLISRLLTDFGIEILFYFEDGNKIKEKLDELYEMDNRKVDFSFRMQDDADWDTVEYMLNEYSSKK